MWYVLMKIIVGLGNPGEKYLKMRHNLGFMVIDRLAQQLEMECIQKKFQSLFCKKPVDQEEDYPLKTADVYEFERGCCERSRRYV